MKKSLPGLLALFLYVTAMAQTPARIDFNKFTPIVSTGTLPDEVEMSGKDFIESSRSRVMKGGNKKEKKTKALFLLESSYAIKELFVSGRVLYNDPISDYVEKVRLEITASDPTLQAETKVFVIKSSVVNAFATNQGYLFITTGLLAQLENEAQLAFVLCHELVHYKKKHVLKGYVENEKIERGDGAYRKSSIDKKYLAKSNYSKENESEADVLGFDLFKQTSYAFEAIDGTFDVLKYSELPFDEVEFSPSKLLETEYLKFPIDYIKEEIDLPEGEDEETDDKFSTHPNLKKRRGDIKDKIDGLDAKEKAQPRKLFAISEDLFTYTRKLARYDLCHTNLISRDYDMAFYEAYVLLQDDPTNVYLKKTILKAIYGLTKYKNADRYREVAFKSKDVEGESQRSSFLFEKLGDNELTVVALNYAWRLKKSLKSEDEEVNLITEDIFYEMVKKHYPNKTSFSLEPRTTPIDTVRKDTPVADAGTKKTSKKSKDEDSSEEEDASSVKKTSKSSSKSSTKSESRTNKIKKKKKVDEKNSFVTYAFVDLLKDPDFVDTYNRLAKQTKKDKSSEKKEDARRKGARSKKKNVDNSEDDDEENQYIMDEKEAATKYNDKRDCYALGVEKVLVLNPFYIRIDERKKTPVLYAGSDESQKEFNDKIANISSDLKLDVEVLDKKAFTTGSVDNYNEMGVLIDWLDERIDHKGIKMLPTDYLQIDNITKKYGTEHISLMGAINFVEKKNPLMTFVCVYLSLFPYTWPFTFPYLFKKKTETYVYTIVFNIKTGQPEMVKYGVTKNSDRSDIINSFLYDYLLQIKRNGNEKNK